jgi:alpha-galactosidase
MGNALPGREPQKKIREDVDRCSILLNFARRDVADYMLETMRKLVRETGIKYLKLDMNCFVSDPGWDEVPAERRRTIWVEYARNLYGLFAALKKEFPDLLIENCASGAGRADLSMDAVFGRINRSDNQDTLDIMKLHEGFTWLHPSKMAGGACHISDGMYGINLRRVPLRTQAYAGMTGSLAIGKNLPKCPQEELDEIASYVKLHKSIRHVVQHGEMYRLASIYDNPYCAFEYVSADKSEAVLFVFGQCAQFSFKVPAIKFKGLDSGKSYEVVRHSPDRKTEGHSAAPRAKSTMSGAGLMEIGVRVEILGDYDSHIVHIKAKG